MHYFGMFPVENMQQHQHLQRIQTRGHVSPDERPPKRSRKGHRQSGEAVGASATAVLPADVYYPQKEKQEEDNLGSDRLARGYQIEIIHRSLIAHEYDSAMKIQNASTSRFLCGNEQFSKAAGLIKQIMQRKNDLNLIYLDKNWKKENTLRSLKEGIRDEFFESLATGRRIQIRDKDKRISLNASFALFQRVSPERLTSLRITTNSFPLCEAMDLLYEKGVPIPRAIWFFKMNQIAHPIIAVNKPKKGSMIMPCDDYASDQRQFFIRYLRCMLKEFEKAIPGQLEQNDYYQRWPYFSSLIKQSFEDGMLDRHEFLMDLCDLLPEFENFPMEQPQTFRVLLILISQFIDVIVQNIFISRRIAYVLCIRLNKYKRDYDRIRNSSELTAKECFDDLCNCQHHRPTILTIFGILHAIIIDCPSALIWTPFDPLELQSKFKSDKSGNSKALDRETYSNNVAWLCNSPLDHLPSQIDLTHHLVGISKSEVDQLLKIRIAEIKQRGRSIENRWEFLSPSNARSGFETVVETCLDVLAFLDTANFGEVDALLTLYNNIFNDGYNMEICIRVLIQWAVSIEREGTHRGLVVAHLLKMHQFYAQINGLKFPFGEGYSTLQDLLMDYLNKEWTKKLTTDSTIRATEFAHLMLLFYELQRFNLFSHDSYVRALMRNGIFDSKGIFLRLNLSAVSISNPSKSSSEERLPSQSVANTVSATSSLNQTQTVKQEPQMIISFIPTAKPSQPLNSLITENQTNNNSSSTSCGHLQTKQLEDFAKLPPQYESDNHPLVIDSAELTFHERFIIHLPVEQLETNRDVCNQRAIILHGISEQRDSAKQELRKIAREICKIWKRFTIELTALNPETMFRELRFKRRCTPEQFSELMRRFHSQTYYDQLVICGWCAESFIDSIEDFVKQLQDVARENDANTALMSLSLSVPAPECLDALCTMMTTCGSINSIITLADELIPFLIQIQLLLHDHVNLDNFSGSVSAQLAYVLVSHLSDHFYYFLYSPEACSIVNDLYRLMESELSCVSKRKEAVGLTGWGRAVAVFIYHAKHFLLTTKLNIVGATHETVIHLLGQCEEFEAIFPSSGAGSVANNLKYQQQLLGDSLARMSFSELRFYSHQNYKHLFHTMKENNNARYSFVIDAFKAAVNCGRDYDRINELANFCSNISANLDMTVEWCNAIQELCYPSASSDDWKELIQDIDATKFSTHYPIATFVLLLASKYTFSTHGLLCRLMANVLHPLLSKQEERNENSNNSSTHRRTDDFGGHDNNFCLTLYICACLTCGTDEPFHYCDNNLKSTSSFGSLFNKDANKLALRIVHLAELETSIFPLLSVISQLVDGLKRRVEVRKESINVRTISLSQHYSVARCALLSICEQEWVIQRMFHLCDTHDGLEMFTHSKSLRNNCIGQQLLRLSLRRRSERNIKQELIEHTGEKKVYEKMLSALNVWNMRATYYDFKLNILEQDPDSQSANGNNCQQYQMVMYQQALFNNVANALFNSFRLYRRLSLVGNLVSQSSSLSAINCFWLIAPLVNALPSPPPLTAGNPQNTLWCPWNRSATKAYFLKVVSDHLSSNSDGAVQYEQLLGYQPFLNLILACTDGEDIKQLLDSLLNYIDDIVKRVKKNPVLPYQNCFMPERDGLILRMNLISGLFDSVLSNSNNESWASAFFQLLYYEIFTYERDQDYFDTIYDMLLLLCYRIYPNKMYTNFIAKFKNLKIPDELHCLQQLLQIAKSQAELTAWDSFSPNKANPHIVGKGAVGSTAQQAQPSLPVSRPQIQGLIVDKQPPSLQKQLLHLLRHQHWMLKQASPKGEWFISIIPHAGLVGEVEMVGYSNPFLAAPEMEQVTVLPLEEQPEMQQQQRQQLIVDQQQQHNQQQMMTTTAEQHARQQQQQLLQAQQTRHLQQQSSLEQQNQFKIEAEHLQQLKVINAQQIKFDPQQPPQQQMMATPPVHQQHPMQPTNMLSQANAQPPQFQQHMLKQQQQHLMSMMGDGVGGQQQFMPPAQQPMISMLQQQSAVRSGTSTPTATTTESPKAGGRGGRRKSAAGANQIGAPGNATTASGTGKGQKRKKEPKQQQQQGPPAVTQQHPNIGGTDIYRGGGGGGGQAMVPPQMNQQMMMQQQQQQHMAAQLHQQQQQQQWQQMQRQQQQPMMGSAIMYTPQQQMQQQSTSSSQAIAPTQFRPQQMPQQQFPIQQQQQQHIRPNQPQFSHPQMMQGMQMQPGMQPQQQPQITQMPQQQQQLGNDPKGNSNSQKAIVHQRLMQKMQQNQQNQAQQQQHTMGMGMPPQ